MEEGGGRFLGGAGEPLGAGFTGEAAELLT